MGLWLRKIGAVILACTMHYAEASTQLPAATDLAFEAQRANQAGNPLILVFSRKDCSYCETIKKNHLFPLSRQPKYQHTLLVRQINTDEDTPLRNFRGELTTHRQFAREQNTQLVPVVAFFNAQGQALTSPIIGARLPDFYQSYLEQTLSEAQQKLKIKP